MSETIPLIDLRRQLKDDLGARITEAIDRVVQSGLYASGPEVPAFEEEWAAVCGARYAVGLSSCSDALYLTLRYCRERGTILARRVATTPVSFWATTEAAIRAGMNVEFIDIDETGNMGRTIRGRGLVNLPVLLYGMPMDYGDRLSDGRLVIEDRAQAHGIPFPKDGILAGCYSFYPTKNLGAMGMAGAVVTNDQDLYYWLRRMRAHGETEERFMHADASGNWRMDEIQAAVLRAKLPWLSLWTERRREIARAYCNGLSYIPALRDQMEKLLWKVDSSVWHIFPIFVQDAARMLAHLKRSGIEAGKRYPMPLHLMPYFSSGAYGAYRVGDFPNAERWCREVVNLPIFETMRDDEVARVIAAVSSAFEMKVVSA